MHVMGNMIAIYPWNNIENLMEDYIKPEEDITE